MKYEHLGHTAFRASNYERSVRFYRDILGLKQKFTLQKPDGTPWLTYMEISRGQFIEIFNWEGEIDNSKAAFRHTCFVVPNIEEAAAELQAKGVQLWYGPSTIGDKAAVPFQKRMGKCGSYGFFVVDPDGNELEFHEFTEKSLQLMNDEQLAMVAEQVRNNTYVPEAATQGSRSGIVGAEE